MTGGDPDRQKANTKEEEKDLGLLNEGMRYRDLDTGTFTTRDPIGYGDGPNVYCYVHCNPITHFDAWGLISDEQQAEVDAAKETADAAEAKAAEASATAETAQKNADVARTAAEKAAQNGPPIPTDAGKARDAAKAQKIANQKASEASLAASAATQARATADKLAKAAVISDAAGGVVDRAIAASTFKEKVTGNTKDNVNGKERFVQTEKGTVDLGHVASASQVVLPNFLGLCKEFEQGVKKEDSAYQRSDFRSNLIGGQAQSQAYESRTSVGSNVSEILFEMMPIGGPNAQDDH